jgi:hypothetical protein
MCENKKLQEPLLLNIDKIVTTLMQNAYRKDNIKSYNVISMSLFTLNMIFYQTANPLICRKYFGNLVIELRKTFNLIGEHKNFLQDGLLSCLQAIVTIIESEITNDDAKNIYQLVKEVFVNIGDVNDEGLQVISWVATGTIQDFV